MPRKWQQGTKWLERATRRGRSCADKKIKCETIVKRMNVHVYREGMWGNLSSGLIQVEDCGWLRLEEGYHLPIPRVAGSKHEWCFTIIVCLVGVGAAPCE